MFKVLIGGIVLFCATFAMAQKVRVEPMTQIGGDSSQAFISQALVQGISSELNRGGTFKVTTAPSESDYVVSGTYQINQNELRITGQVVDAKKNHIGSIKATGALRDLFMLEDEVARQVKAALKSNVPATVVATTLPARELPVIQPSGPVRVELSPSNSFEGSQLQQALITGRDPAVARSNYDRYYYNPPAPYPWYGYGYTSPYYYGVYGTGYYNFGGYFGTYPMNVYVDHSHDYHSGHHGDRHWDGRN